jgi:hypothetical protein
MPCPVCSCNIGQADHRMCVIQLFREDKIKSVAEWQNLCRPVTIRKGKIIAYLPKTETTPQSN